MPKNKIDQALDDTLVFIDDHSTPDLMTQEEAAEYYRSLISELEIRFQGLEE